MSFLSQPVTLQSLIGQNRTIGDITVNVILNEETTDTLTITKQPVQTGAQITDHSFLEPAALSMSILQQDNDVLTENIQNTFNGNSLAQLYQTFLDLQASRTPFTVFTPKRVYKSMLMTVVRSVTDKKTENILALNLAFQKIIIVSIGVATVPPSRQRKVKATQKTTNTGKDSAALSAEKGINPKAVGFHK